MEGNKEEHPLQREYQFWYSKYKKPDENDKKLKMSKEDFESELKSLKTFSTVEEFWGLFLHMKTPSQLETGSKLFLFQGNIRPVWEDEMNKNGGRFYFKVKQDQSDQLWQELCLAYISEDFDYNNQICGLQLAVRPDNVIMISIWTQYMKRYIKDECTDWIKDYLGLSSWVRIFYNNHPRPKDCRRGGAGNGRGRDNYKYRG